MISLLRSAGFVAVALASLFLTPRTHAAETASRGTVVTAHLQSHALRETRTGLDPNRSVKVYLPPGYADSGKAYPVVYYCHSINWNPEKMFEDGNLVRLIERAVAAGFVPEFILVAADYSSPTMGSWFENSSTTGRWLDFTIDELVPFIDGRFRTLPQRESRAIVGDFLGGYGALKFAMLRPDLFSVVYAMHPVATGSGLMPMQSMVDWRRLHAAKSFSDLWSDYYAPGFVAIAQAYLPNPDRPPFYCDFIVELVNGEPTLNAANVRKMEQGFYLDELLREKADSLRQMRGLAFDWGRYDVTQSHVYSNQAFTRTLDQLGIEHTAEEYNGNQWDKNWTADGRFYTRVLPFLGRHLVVGTP